MQRAILQLESSSEILRRKARALTLEEIKSSDIQSLIEEMKQIMRNAPGVGLAAPQIGMSIQLAVIEDPDERHQNLSPEVLLDRGRKLVPFHVIINPKITLLGERMNYFFEGCLSVKNRVRVTPRHHSVRVECLDEKGESKIIVAHGWYARILQHEIGHLNGQLYVDLSDPRTELEVDEAFKMTWMNALSPEINAYFKQKCLDCSVESESHETHLPKMKC